MSAEQLWVSKPLLTVLKEKEKERKQRSRVTGNQSFLAFILVLYSSYPNCKLWKSFLMNNLALELKKFPAGSSVNLGS